MRQMVYLYLVIIRKPRRQCNKGQHEREKTKDNQWSISQYRSQMLEYKPLMIFFEIVNSDNTHNVCLGVNYVLKSRIYPMPYPKAVDFELTVEEAKEMIRSLQYGLNHLKPAHDIPND